MKTFTPMIIILFISLILSNCISNPQKDGRINQIDIADQIDNMKQINLSDFITGIKYVLLETPKNTPLRSISLLDIYSGKILISDTKECIQYDDNGKFISKISNFGRGPGEYQYMINIGYDVNSKIFIQSLYDFLEFEKNGYFLKKYYKSLIINHNGNGSVDYICSWISINDSLFLGKVGNSGGNAKYKAVIFKSNGVIVKYFENPFYNHAKKPFGGPLEQQANLFHYDGKTYYKEIYNDTLFNLNEDSQLIPTYVINFGKFSLPLVEGDINPSYFSSNLGDYMWLNNIFHSTNYLFLDCNFGNRFPVKRLTSFTVLPGTKPIWYNTRSVLGIYDLSKKELVFCEPTSTDNPLSTTGFYNDYDGGPRFFPKKMINDSTMLMWLSAEHLKAHIASENFINSLPKYPQKKMGLKAFTDKLNEYDNPVLMIVSFKNRIHNK